HGGPDGGAVGVGGLIEDGINLEIAFILRDLFVLNGFEVVMTREEDVSIHDADVRGLRAQKTSDLNNRLAFTERYSDNIFISIHQNKFSDSRQWGAQVFYGQNHPGSAELAELVQRGVVSMLQPENKRLAKAGGSNLFLIDRARSPAILVEGGFLSNPQDAANLSDPEYQAKLAFAIFCSVLAYLGMELPVSLA
ncbi:MAG: N-acetylmuramoyl-L-alanine amidase, partial [Oscillospiraceae bacterium]|nr:N-acetylmuramoyl-L-alanine amidase [Oscillospiraceae bacterium]